MPRGGGRGADRQLDPAAYQADPGPYQADTAAYQTDPVGYQGRPAQADAGGHTGAPGYGDTPGYGDLAAYTDPRLSARGPVRGQGPAGADDDDPLTSKAFSREAMAATDNRSYRASRRPQIPDDRYVAALTEQTQTFSLDDAYADRDNGRYGSGPYPADPLAATARHAASGQPPQPPRGSQHGQSGQYERPAQYGYPADYGQPAEYGQSAQYGRQPKHGQQSQPVRSGLAGHTGLSGESAFPDISGQPGPSYVSWPGDQGGTGSSPYPHPEQTAPYPGRLPLDPQSDPYGGSGRPAGYGDGRRGNGRR